MMLRSRHWLTACAALSLMACGSGGPEAPKEAVQERLGSRTSDVEAALAAMPGTEVLGANADGVPYMIRGAFGSTGRGLLGATAPQVHGLLGPTLERIAPVFRLRARDLVPLRATQDDQGHTHLRYGQMKNGLPVVAQELIVHLDEHGRAYAVNGTARDGESVSAEPRIGTEAARHAALSATRGGTTTEEALRLVYVRAPDTDRLALVFDGQVKGQDGDAPVHDHVFVSAVDGKEVWRYSNLRAAKNRRVCSATTGICRTETSSPPPADPAINAVFDNLGHFYDCLWVNFSQDSYNGAGALLAARVHYGANYVNAYFNGSELVCTDGDGVTMGAPCEDTDIVDHEFTHAVTDLTSGLIYSGESGGLNESLSDIFAATCHSWAIGPWFMTQEVWWIAEGAFTPGTPGDALRYMDDPKDDGASLDYYADYSSGVDVHYTSGIPNLAFKLLSTGGTHPRGRSTVAVPAIGIQFAARIFYKANRDLFTASTSLAQAKTYTKVAAQQLGYATSIQSAVDSAWEAVGVGVPLPPPPCTSLTNGVPLTGISGAAGSSQYYCLTVPANTSSTLTTSGGTGDVDLYVKFGAAPTTSSYDCRPYRSGNNETCVIPAHTSSGQVWVMLKGYTAYSGVTLLGQY